MSLETLITGWGPPAVFLGARHLPDRGAMARLRARARGSRLAAGLDRRRHLAAFLFRFMPGARIAGPVLLAQTGIGWPAYAAANALAVVVWATLFTALGYHFGMAAETALGRLAAQHWLILAGLAGVAGLVLHRHLRRRR